MSSLLVTAPAIEPVSLAKAKAFLQVETGDDNDVIDVLIAGSYIHVEAQAKCTPALTGDVAQWAMIVLAAYFGGRSLVKVARNLGRK